MLALIPYILSPAGRIAMAVILTMAVIGGIYLKGRSDGSDTAIDRINDETERARQAARDAARTVDDCYALSDGVRWNVARARCERYPGDSGK